MRRFQSHKLVARLLLCPENTGSERTPISSVIEGIADEEGIFVGKPMVQTRSKVIFVRGAESGVVVFGDSLRRIHNGPIGQRPERVYKWPHCWDCRCSHGCCRYQ